MRNHLYFKTAVVLAMGLSMAPIQGAEVDTATNVFARHFAAAGGREAFQQVETVVVRGTGREGASAFNFEISQKKPGCMLLVIRNRDQVLMRMGRDDQARCWQEHRDMGIRDVPGSEQGHFMDLAIGLFPPSLLHFNEALKQSVCEEVQDQGRTLVALGKADKGATYARLMFDKTSGLLARVSDVRLDDYREVEGIKLPFRLKPDERSEFQIEKVELNPPLEISIFRKPSQAVTVAPQVDSAENYGSLLSSNGLQIVRKPGPMLFGREKLDKLPAFNPASGAPAQVDLRSFDLRGLNASKRMDDLMHADFDSCTRWPAQLPIGFDHDRIMELGKDPGLGVRKLHERGLAGQGIGIGIIDQTLLVDHVEYADRLKLYEEIHNPAWCAQMHGPAVASIALGKSLGVAPKADLYYIAETHGIFRADHQFDWDFAWVAKSIDRLLEVNAGLPKDKKIRVISISVGWSPEQKGYREAMAAVDRATKQNVFVISTALKATHHLEFHGLGRSALTNPNDFNAFEPGSWWAATFWAGQLRFQPGERLMVPMDSRATASPTGANDYVFYANGGWSWSVPWIAGLYALACEVKPDVTPELFWSTALKTGRTITLKHEGTDIRFGTIADPVALIEALRGTGT